MHFAAVALLSVGLADDPVFSGPQPGEKAPAFKVVGVYDDEEGKEREVKSDKDKPMLLVFVHELTRPSAGLMRALSAYAATREKDGVKTLFVWLSADRTETTAFLKRAKMSLNLKSPVAISLDGIEGPGTYGLNRKVGLTMLVIKDGKVASNFALVQPAMTDAPKIAEAICKAAGGKAPTLKELEALAFPGRQPDRDPQLVTLMRQLIQKNATEEDVRKTATEVEKLVANDLAKQKQVAEISTAIAANNYGTEAAQKQAKAWVEKYKRQ